jgi:transcriptional regulator with XRE-family HTH domain
MRAGAVARGAWFRQNQQYFLYIGINSFIKQGIVSRQTDPAPALRDAGAPAADDLTHAIAQHVRRLRAAKQWSLEALAAQSGVSRSMLSAIERAHTNPSAVTLDRIASALGVSLTQLLESPNAVARPLMRAAEQPLWTEPSTGYRRRSLSPPSPDSRLRLMEVEFPAQARIAFESNGVQPPIQQQIWLIAGRMKITHGADCFALEPGDCLAMRIDQAAMFYNPGHEPARYLVAQA